MSLNRFERCAEIAGRVVVAIAIGYLLVRLVVPFLAAIARDVARAL